MNRFYLMSAVLLIAGCSPKFQQETQPSVPGYHLRYDHHALRIPGDKFPIGLVVPAQGKNAADTIGYPGKSGKWGKYHLEVDSGSASSGQVKLKDSKIYKKGDSLTVNVYARKSFLGGRGKFLTSRKIPYSFEDSIALMTNANTDRYPGGHVTFGVRSYYNNKQFTDLWYPLKSKDRDDFILGFDGGHLSKSKGDWKIDPDPAHIQNDQVSLFAALSKAPSIRDTLRLMLDYKARFRCVVPSNGDGHELDVNADLFDDSIIHAKLLVLVVRDNATQRIYHYLINTQGGSIDLASIGADGARGEDGSSGYDGANGADGAISQVPQTTTDTAGKEITIYVTVQGPGGDGQDGGYGADGANGYNGGNGGNITVYYTPAAAPFLQMINARSVPGSGGPGGSGGSGGNGGNGGIGNPPGKRGRRGQDGIGGTSGQNGSPGAVRFVPQ